MQTHRLQTRRRHVYTATHWSSYVNASFRGHLCASRRCRHAVACALTKSKWMSTRQTSYVMSPSPLCFFHHNKHAPSERNLRIFICFILIIQIYVHKIHSQSRLFPYVSVNKWNTFIQHCSTHCHPTRRAVLPLSAADPLLRNQCPDVSGRLGMSPDVLICEWPCRQKRCRRNVNLWHLKWQFSLFQVMVWGCWDCRVVYFRCIQQHGMHIAKCVSRNLFG